MQKPPGFLTGQEVLENKAENNNAFLRYSKSGNLEKMVEVLTTCQIDINTSNQNGLNALHLACKEGHLHVVKELLNRKIPVDEPTKKGNTSLHIASIAGHDNIVRLLIQNNAKVNSQSQNGFTPLYMAAQENNTSIVKILLKSGANQSLATEDGFTPLSVALQQGHNVVVRLLMENDPKGRVRLPALHVAAKKNDVHAAMLLIQRAGGAEDGVLAANESTKSGFTPLHIAAHYGSLNVAQVLLQNGADVNSKARNAITPLHVACKWGKADMVVLLINFDANTDCKTRDSLTPMHCACRSGHLDVVKCLVNRGCVVDTRTRNGLTPLHMAAQGDHVECASFLLINGATVDDKTIDFLTPLHVASHCGNVKMVRFLLDNKCQVNARAMNGFTPLHVACKKNRLKIVEILLRYGGQVESQTESGLTPLHVASFMGYQPIVLYLLQHHSNIESLTVRGETSLHLAARANQIEIMRLLIREGARVDAKAKEGQTPLHVSSRLGSLDGVDLLLRHRAAKDAQTKDMYTPLHIAVKEGHEELVKTLLDNGAKLNLNTKRGFTALHIASKYNNLSIARALLNKGSNPNSEGKNGLTPLHVATHYNSIETATFLLEKGASPHAVAKNGFTPLHIAAKKCQVEISKLLLKHGAKTNAESKNGFSPLHLTSQEGNMDLLSILLDKGALVDQKANNNLTAMHLAAQEDHVPVARMLFQHKAKIDPITKAGYTPLHTACHFGQLNMVQFLLEHGAAVNSLTQMGYTPLHQSAQQGHIHIIHHLLKNKSSPDILTNDGMTALGIADKLGYVLCADVLRKVTKVNSTFNQDSYLMVTPEIMQEVPMDSDDDIMDATMMVDKSYHYLSVDDVKDMRYNVQSPTEKGDFDDMQSPNEDNEMAYIWRGLNSTHIPTDLERDKYAKPGQGRGPLYKSFTQKNTKPPDDQLLKKTNGHIIEESFDQSKQSIILPTSPSLQYALTTDSPKLLVPASKSMQFVTGQPILHSDLMKSSILDQPGMHLPGLDSQRFGGSMYSNASGASSFNPDNISIDRHPIHSGFLVSFIVDARGGAMSGCRHSGVRILVPPDVICQPIRITCKLVKKDKLLLPPALDEGEGLASRILQMGPVDIHFSSPILIEVPHFASLRNNEREIIILKSVDGKSWIFHSLSATPQQTNQAVGKYFELEEFGTTDKLANDRVARIIISEFPKYFAVVSRLKHETKIVGSEGCELMSSILHSIKVFIPPKSILNKSLPVALQVVPVDSALVARITKGKLLASSIVTVYPRHRKFHEPINITIPLPNGSKIKTGKSGEIMDLNLRLLCSMAANGFPTKFEDMTGMGPLILNNDLVNFSTNVSARFWLVESMDIPCTTKMAHDVFKELLCVPYLTRFLVFGKQKNKEETKLRVFCVTDDKVEKTVECRQKFTEIARSKDIEVFENKIQQLEVVGNIIPVSNYNRKNKVEFHPFSENRMQMNVKLYDINEEPLGQVIILPPPPHITRNAEGRVNPVCVLNVSLASMVVVDDCSSFNVLSKGSESIARGELRLTDVADTLQGDWIMLAQYFHFDPEDILKIQNEYTYSAEQALVLLHMWIELYGNEASGNVLERALEAIGRRDVIEKCMGNMEEVTEQWEIQHALSQVLQDDEDTTFGDTFDLSKSCSFRSKVEDNKNLEKEAHQIVQSAIDQFMSDSLSK